MLSTDFPTRRAYGITTAYTVDAVVAAGHSASVLSTSNLPSHGASRFYQTVQPWFRRRFSLPYSIGAFAHHASRALFFHEVERILASCATDAFWIRDFYLGAKLRSVFPQAPICIEVHQPPSRRQMRSVCRADSANTLWGPISPVTEEALTEALGQGRLGDVTRVPMAAADAFFSTSPGVNSGLPNSQQIKTIGYFGSFQSGGFDQGVAAMVREILRFETLGPVELLLVGIGEEGKRVVVESAKDIRSAIRLVVLPHVHHHEVPRLIRKCDVLVLPYPGGSPFFDARFPLKLVEYAASQRPIVLTKTRSHLGVFPVPAGYYYDGKDPRSFRKALASALTYDGTRQRTVSLAYDWARGHTYEARVRPVLSWLEKRLYSSRGASRS